MKLYSMKQAVNPQRVRIFLAEKGLDVETIEIDIPSGENRSDDYLKVSPRGLLPALVLDDGDVLVETVAICKYIEATNPSPPLLGTTPKEQAIIEMRQREMEFDGLQSIAWIFRNTAPHFTERSQPGAVPDMEQLPQLAARGQVLTAVWLERLNALLSQSRHVAGDAFSIADITAYCAVKFARWVKISIPENHEHTLRWYADVKERPTMKA
ncbi:MAG: glutathione S-transferase family protein [Pseudomonadota bacterium]